MHLGVPGFPEHEPSLSDVMEHVRGQYPHSYRMLLRSFVGFVLGTFPLTGLMLVEDMALSSYFLRLNCWRCRVQFFWRPAAAPSHLEMTSTEHS